MERAIKRTSLLKVCRQKPREALSNIVEVVLKTGINPGRLQAIAIATELVCRQHPFQASIIRLSVLLVVAKRIYHELVTFRNE